MVEAMKSFGNKARPPEPAVEAGVATAGTSASAQPAVAAPAAASVPEPSWTSTEARRAAAPSSEPMVRSDVFRVVRNGVFATMNASAAVGKTRDQMRGTVEQMVAVVAEREYLNVTMADQNLMVEELLNDMFGLGPIEPLLADESVTDVLVNGPDQVFVERRGRLELTPYKFRDNMHVANVAQRIAAGAGRRVDESSPMVDARLADGSRVNVVLPPLALKGAAISIRKFPKRKITLDIMAKQANLSANMAKLLKLAGRCRLNIIVAGGTGSGKTTLLNALSHYIGDGERIVTIEDAAELQLQQPHVVSLETRPENTEGLGGVNQRDLVRNSLRMRPDRIILGETRGPEAFDVLQAMNTGHDGSMTTIHANTPRDAITRLESMVMMANGNLPLMSIRRQIASAVHMFVQIERMRDGVRRITRITELVGMEGEVIITQDLFAFRYDATSFGDEVKGNFERQPIRPAFYERATYYGLQDAVMEAMS
ncbi:CpaF family protein [Burkholderia sp. 22PA0099]|uniref:CpaF family protein n=1 Tax=Burkholderia sp. 22PA0099 TaxID=3237372 RepID=UPI0039C45A6F